MRTLFVAKQGPQTGSPKQGLGPLFGEGGGGRPGGRKPPNKAGSRYGPAADFRPFPAEKASRRRGGAFDPNIGVGRRRPTPFEPLAERRRKASGFERRQGGAFDGVRPCPQLPRAKTPTKKVSAITRASDYTRHSLRGPRPCPSYKEMRVLWPASLPFVQKNAACVRRPTPFEPPALL